MPSIAFLRLKNVLKTGQYLKHCSIIAFKIFTHSLIMLVASPPSNNPQYPSLLAALILVHRLLRCRFYPK